MIDEIKLILNAQADDERLFSKDFDNAIRLVGDKLNELKQYRKDRASVLMGDAKSIEIGDKRYTKSETYKKLVEDMDAAREAGVTKVEEKLDTAKLNAYIKEHRVLPNGVVEQYAYTSIREYDKKVTKEIENKPRSEPVEDLRDTREFKSIKDRV